MNLTPPTDNLYKFFTISGIVILIGFILKMNMDSKEHNKVKKESSIKVLELRADSTKTAFQLEITKALLYKHFRDSLNTVLDKLSKTDTRLNILTAYPSSIELFYKYEKLKSDKEKITQTICLYQKDITAFKDSKFMPSYGIMTVVYLSGMILFFLGFYKWVELQYTLDVILKNEKAKCTLINNERKKLLIGKWLEKLDSFLSKHTLWVIGIVLTVVYATFFLW